MEQKKGGGTPPPFFCSVSAQPAFLIYHAPLRRETFGAKPIKGEG